MTKGYSVAILGATGAVGERMVKSLETAGLPIDKIQFLSSARSAGSKVTFQGQQYSVVEASPDCFEGVQIVLSSAGGEVSKVLLPEAVKRGAICIDNTSAFRMDENVPLVVPEVNEADLFQQQGIIANPNCSTIQMVAALEPLRKAYGLNKIVVSTYQPVSGAGVSEIHELERHTKAVLNNE